ncbi:hypothetical protein [Sphingobacterium multivorum]|uniref:hypothetical protein n=1 Tax=Sphingobacterium multivorum TaxID=28454 RepID=UPI0031BB7CE3
MAQLKTVLTGDATSLTNAMKQAEQSATSVSKSFEAAKLSTEQWDAAARRNSFEQYNASLRKVNASTKEVSTSSQEAVVSVNKLNNSVKAGSGVAVEFTRIIQDLPYAANNIGSVGNNITRAFELFGSVRQQAGSTAIAIKSVFSSLLSTGNLISLGVSAVITGFTMWQMHSQKTKRETDNLTDAIQKQRDAVENYLKTLNAVNRSSAEASANYAKEFTELNILFGIIKSGTSTREQQTIAVERLQKLYPDIFANMTREAILADEGARAYDRLKNSIIQAGIAEAAKNLSAKAAEDYVKNTVAGLQATKDATKLFHEYNRAIAAKNLLERDAAKYVGQTITVNGVNFKVQKDNSLAITQLNTIINQLGREYSAANDKTKTFITTSAEARKNMDEFNKVAIESAPALQKNTGLIGELQDKISKLEAQRPFLKTKEDIQENIKQTTLFKNELKSLESPLEDQAGLIGEVKNKLKQLNKERPFLKTKEDIQANIQETNKYKKQLAELEKGLKKVGGARVSTAVPKNLIDQVQSVGQKGQFSVQVSQATGLDELLLRNKQKYQGFLDELDKLEKENKGKNIANAKATQDAINKTRIDLVTNREAEAKQIELDYNTSTQDTITKILNDAGISRVKSRQQELDASKNYFNELENQYRNNSTVLQAITEARKLAEASINEKFDAKAYEGVKKMYDKIEKLENKPFAKNLKGDELKKAIADRLAAIEDIYKKIDESLKAMGVKDTSAIMGGLKQSFDTVTGNAPNQKDRDDAELNKRLSKVVESGFRQGFSSIFDSIDDLGSNFYDVFSNTFNKLSNSVIKTFQNLIATELGNSFSKLFEGKDGKGFKIGGLSEGVSKGVVAGLGIAGGLVSSMSGKTSTGGQIAGGALSGAAAGTAILPGWGTAIGAVVGGAAGFFGAKNAQKQQKIAEQQLSESKKQTLLLQYQNALSYQSNIAGQRTVDGIITAVDRSATGQLIATIAGKDIKVILDRNGGAR